MSYAAEPLAGACLRPLGHLSGGPLLEQIPLSARGNRSRTRFVRQQLNLRFRTTKTMNESALDGALRTPAVQAIHATFWSEE